MADLRTDYKDDVLNTEVNELRKYQMIQNEDGTVSFVDVTDYLQVGDSFGSADVNAITKKLTEDILDTMEEIEANTEENKIAGALAVKEVIEEVNSKFEYTTRDELGVFTEDGTYELDFSGYKKILIYLTALNVSGTYEIIDVDLIISDAFPIISKSLQAGDSTYNVMVSYILNKNTIQIKQLISAQANKQVRLYGIK